jgi:ABC-type transport system involved in cytochrome bd biosynthesis fused ATPase/permease subunit
VSSPGPPAPLPREVDQAWRRRLLHGDWRLWDLELFHLLLAILGVLIALLAASLVNGMRHEDGNVRISVLFVAGTVAALVVVRGAARAGLRAAERRTAGTAALAARRELLDAVGRGAPVRAGAAASFVTRGATDVGDYLARAIPARAIATVVPIGILVVLAFVDPWSALLAAAVAAAVPFVLAPIGRRATAEAEAGVGRLRSLATRALELLEGAVELRALGAVRRGCEELAAATERTVASTRRSLHLALRSATSLDVLAGAAIGLVAMLNGFRLLDGSIGLGHALAAVLLTAEVFVPLRTAGAAFHQGADGRAALATLAATVDAAPPARDEPAAALPAVAVHPAAVTAERLELAARRGGPTVLGPIDVHVPAGGALVVTGPTGSGKSTLLRAVAGAPLRVEGALRVGNADPAVLSTRQRSALVAVVDQRPFLVDGSLYDNLLLGRRGVVDDDAVDDAVARCGLTSLLARAPRGLDERVGEEGRLLSAGERTRVALARAVLRGPGVLLLDEVGAHLDDASLVVLRAALAAFLSSRTVLEAAHDRPLLVEAPRLELAAVGVAP